MTHLTDERMESVVIYGTGSPILADVEESLCRAGIGIYAGVQNRPGKSFHSEDVRVVPCGVLPDDVKERPFLIPLFTPGNRQEAAREAERLGFGRPFSLIDPTVSPPRTLRFEPGLYVNAGCTLGAASEFDAFVFINRGAGVGHHVRLGRFVSIGPGAVIAGLVTIGKGSMIGPGAVVLPEITIGENAVVGAGATVTRDVPDRCVVLGNPARVVKRGIAGYHDRTVE
jgi:sugar O-acyltransferase (sialic acid O-acetyltransferase NeuD family)